jgi:hypothetical protein
VLPAIQFSEETWVDRFKNAAKMDLELFPNANVPIVENIWNENLKHVEAQGAKPFRKCILRNDPSASTARYYLVNAY